MAVSELVVASDPFLGEWKAMCLPWILTYINRMMGQWWALENASPDLKKGVTFGIYVKFWGVDSCFHHGFDHHSCLQYLIRCTFTSCCQQFLALFGGGTAIQDTTFTYCSRSPNQLHSSPISLLHDFRWRNASAHWKLKVYTIIVGVTQMFEVCNVVYVRMPVCSIYAPNCPYRKSELAPLGPFTSLMVTYSPAPRKNAFLTTDTSTFLFLWFLHKLVNINFKWFECHDMYTYCITLCIYIYVYI